MAQKLHIAARGLVTDPNPLATGPGALSEALNVVVARQGVIEPRPSIPQHAVSWLDEEEAFADTRIVGIFPYNDDLVIALQAQSGEDAGLTRFFVTSSGLELVTVNERKWMEFDTIIDPPSLVNWNDYRSAPVYAPFGELRGVVMRGNLYIATDVGVLRVAGFEPRDVDRIYTTSNGVTTTEPGSVYAQRAGLRRDTHADVDFFSDSTSAAGVANHPVATEVEGAYAVRVCRSAQMGDVKVRSAPSGPAVTRFNTTGGGNSHYVAWDLPGGTGLNEDSETAAGDAIEIYRSTSFVPDEEATPSDEMALIGVEGCFEHDFRDEVPESGPYGEALYSNETQQGALRENGIPPFCVDLAVYEDTLFFAGAQWAPRVAVGIVAIGPDSGPSGYDPVVDGITYYDFSGTSSSGDATLTGTLDAETLYVRVGTRLADASSTDPTAADTRFPSGTYVIDRDRLPTDAGTVEASELALSSASDTFRAADWIEIEWTDSDGTHTHRAFAWDSDAGTLAPDSESAFDCAESTEGCSAATRLARRLTFATYRDIVCNAYGDGSTESWNLLFEGYEPDLESITIRLSNPRAAIGFTPDDIAGTAEITVGRDGTVADFAWTKLSEPEHVPPVEYRTVVGDDDKRLRRVIPTRNSLFLFKDDGVWRATGIGDAVRVSEFDRTIRLVHPEAACAWNGMAAAWTSRGVLLISDAGVQDITDQRIAFTLRERAEDLMENAADVTGGVFLVAWEARDMLLLGVPGAAADGYAEYIYAYCVRTGAWSRWTHSEQIVCAAVSGVDLYFGTRGDAEATPKLLKAAPNVWGGDAEHDATIETISGNVITGDSGDYVPSVGDLVIDASDNAAVIMSIDGVNITVDDASDLAVGAATVVSMPQYQVDWVAEDGDSPGNAHFWNDVQMIFGGSGEVRRLGWSFYTDRYPTPVASTQSLDATTGSPPGTAIKRVPRNVRTGTRLYSGARIYPVRPDWSIHGLSVRFDRREPRARRGTL